MLPKYEHRALTEHQWRQYLSRHQSWLFHGPDLALANKFTRAVVDTLRQPFHSQSHQNSMAIVSKRLNYQCSLYCVKSNHKNRLNQGIAIIRTGNQPVPGNQKTIFTALIYLVGTCLLQNINLHQS